jgi:ADP-dependent phosphofructokinase/glucokinase
VLISGYSQIVDRKELDRAIHETIAAVERWRAAGPELFIHLELGAMPGTDDLRRVVTRLREHVDSVGCNEDEFRDLTVSLGVPMTDSEAEMRRAIETLRAALGVRRLVLHTARFAASAGEFEPEREREALLFAGLVASTRARIGRLPDVGDCLETLERARVNERSSALIAAWADAPDAVAIPALEVEPVVASVGLGDSFTAAYLARV